MTHIGISLPVSAADARPDMPVTFARQAEEAGFDSIWIMDRLVFHNQEPLVTLGALAATTSRVRLGTSVLLPALRPPTLLAKMLATLDQLSGGRITLGMGVGSRPDDFAAAEVSFEHRGSRAEELVEVLRLVWSGQAVRHEGRFYQLDVDPVGPTPVQPHLPIWLGGSSDSALRRVARVADGFIGSSSSGPSGFAANWEKIRRHAESSGRDPSSITPAALVYSCVDDDRGRAVARAQAYGNHYYGGARSRSVDGMLLGPPDACVRVAESYFKAGLDTMIVGSADADPATFGRLCTELLPALRKL